jgi:Na+/glutamate symporter
MGDDPDKVVKEANIFSNGFSYVTIPGIKATEKGVAAAIAGGIGGVIIGGIIGAVAHKTFIIQGRKKKFNEMKETVLERIYSNGSRQ